jgi:hypothetical protein
MAIATKPKPKASHHKKRVAAHHQQTKHYMKSYWPYLPMLAVVGVGLMINGYLTRPVTVLGVSTNLSQQALLSETNQDRLDGGRAALRLNTQYSKPRKPKPKTWSPAITGPTILPRVANHGHS